MIFTKICKVVLVSLIMIIVSIGCAQVDIDDIDSLETDENQDKPENVWMDLYPGDEIIYKDANNTLFATHIKANSPDAAIGSFNIKFSYDEDIIEYKSIYSRYAIVEETSSPGKLEVKSTNTAIVSGDYLELFDITWTAKYTGKTDISWRIDKLADKQDIPIETKRKLVDEINIVKILGKIKFILNPESINSGDTFVQNIHLDSENKSIESYNFEIPFNNEIMELDTSIGDNGIEAGVDGFIDNITINEDNIIITGTTDTGGVIGSDLDFIKINWIALKRGEGNLSLKINEMYTTDNVRIKPNVASRSISIHSISTPGVDIWMDPPQIDLSGNETFSTKIILDTKKYRIAAYGIDIIYDPDVLELDDSQGGSVQAGADGFLTVVNPYVPGEISTAGFDAFGIDANPELELLIIYWKTKNITVSSEINMVIKSLADIRTQEIKRDSVEGCSVSVTEVSD